MDPFSSVKFPIEVSISLKRPSRLKGPSSDTSDVGLSSPNIQFASPEAVFSKLICGFLSVKDAISTRLEKRGHNFTRALMPSIDANCCAENPSGLSISTRPALALITGKTLSFTSPDTVTLRASSFSNCASIFSLYTDEGISEGRATKPTTPRTTTSPVPIRSFFILSLRKFSILHWHKLMWDLSNIRLTIPLGCKILVLYQVDLFGERL